MNDRHLDPIEEPQRRRVPGTNNIFELWDRCETCKGTGLAKAWVDGHIVKDECPRCHGEGGRWELEINE